MARASHRHHSLMAAALIPFILWIGAFLLLPAIRIVMSSFQVEDGQGFTLGHFERAFRSPVFSIGMVNSIKISLFSSVIGIVAGWIGAYSFSRFSPRVRDTLLNLSNIMTNFAGVPLAFSLIVLFGTSGMLTVLLNKLGWPWLALDLYSWNGLLLAYIYFQIPLAVLLLYPALYGIKEEWKEAACLVGASGLQFWRHIGIPVLLPSAIGTLNILFANAMGAYATAYALLTSSATLLPIQIAGLVSGDIFPRYELGSALAVILTLFMVLPMLVNQWMLKLVRRRLR